MVYSSIWELVWLIQPSLQEQAAQKLDGIRCAWIPYRRPGAPLTLAVRAALDEKPDVLLLANHGIVVGGFDDPDLKKLLGKDLGVAITGHEPLATTLVLTEGFGEIAMARTTFDLLKSREGMKASINGATQIRAGVIRPEIAVPVEGEPHFGRLGKVTELPNDLRKMESESMVRVLGVRFEDGSEALLPRANVEMIEG